MLYEVITVPCLSKDLFGKLFADKGYISQDLFTKLFQEDVQLITGLRKNMQNRLMPWVDKLLLRKRAIIETINDQLKNISQIEHSRHRSFVNFFVNLIAGLIARITSYNVCYTKLLRALKDACNDYPLNKIGRAGGCDSGCSRFSCYST